MPTHTALPTSYPQWRAPREDGAIIIWPDPADLLRQTRDNHQRLNSTDIRIANVPLPELRRRQRQWIGHDPDQLLIATGHQTELYHPGVWVKNLLIHHAAQALDGQAYHLAVDTDEPKHLVLRWLGGSQPITDDPHLESAGWSALVAPPTPAHVQQIEQQFSRDSAGWDYSPMIGQFLHAVRRRLLEESNLSSLIVNAAHELDWELGLRHHALICSPIWYSEPYLALVHHILSRADAFGAQYNAALADYRRANGLKTATRPMPDLKRSDALCEAAFWLDRLDTGARDRAAVSRTTSHQHWRLVLSDGEAFEFDPSADGLEVAGDLARWLRQHQVRLTPRALTLTMFFRLLLVDQFVHGIGGGRYDQVLDRLIASHFGIAPPGFSVTTATLYTPQAIGRQRACLPCVLHEGHQLRHRLLGEEKMDLVRQIESLPRRSLQRSVVFHRLHHRLDEAAANHPALSRWEQKLRQTEQQVREDEILFNRELFYAMQPRTRLMEMVDRYGQAIQGK